MPTHLIFFFFFFNDTATTEIYTLSLHDALPISHSHRPDLLVAQSRGSIRLELQLPVVRRIGRPDHWRRERDGAHDRSLQQSLHRSRNPARSEEHTSELQSRLHLVCRLLLEKKKKKHQKQHT